MSVTENKVLYSCATGRAPKLTFKPLGGGKTVTDQEGTFCNSTGATSC